MMEEFDLEESNVGKKTDRVSFRLEDWLSLDLTNFMNTHNSESKTQALHDYVKSLKVEIENLKKKTRELESADHVKELKIEIEQLRKRIRELESDRDSYVKEKTPSAMPSATASAEQPAQAPVIPKAPPALTIHCPHYAKQGLKNADISEHTCQKIQEVRPDLCKAVKCSRFKLAPAAVQVSLETDDTRPKGLV